MTVSMNTGGGMRSDFMISDAAIPMRMEELDSAKQDFSQYLQGTAEEAKAVEAPAEQPIEQPTEQAVTAEDIPAKPIKQSAKELAENYDNLVILCGHYEGVDERYLLWQRTGYGVAETAQRSVLYSRRAI